KVKIAGLYRTKAQSRVFEETVRRSRISDKILGDFSFYERQEVKDIIAYHKLVLNAADDLALLRVINTPAGGIGKTTLDELQSQAQGLGGSRWEALCTITDRACDRPVNLTNRAKDALRSFKRVIESLQRIAGEATAGEKRVSDVVIAAI